MKKKTRLMIFVTVMLLCLLPAKVRAAENIDENLSMECTAGTTEVDLSILPSNEELSYEVKRCSSGYDGSGYLNFFYNWRSKGSSDTVVVQAKSSDPKVIELTNTKYNIYCSSFYSSGGGYGGFGYTIHKVGKASITLSIGKTSCRIDMYVLPEQVEIRKISQSGTKVKVEWKSAGCDGYIIERASSSSGPWTQVGKAGASAVAKNITASWNVSRWYRVHGYFLRNGKMICLEDYEISSQPAEFTAEPLKTKITSVSKQGSSSLKIKWKKMSGATGYVVYSASSDNGKYKKLYTAKSGNTISYTHKVSKGKTYFYYVVAVYGNVKSEPSMSFAGMLPKSGKASGKTQTKVNQEEVTAWTWQKGDSVSVLGGKGQYSGWNWAKPDQTYYYESGGKYCVVCVQDNGSLQISELNLSMKYTSQKKVKLGKYDVWGGFYKGTDGNFYVAVGYYNLKESDSKTVIKVMKYNSKWKLQKTCSIKGSASNAFKGIYSPFEAGSCRMDMQGSTLYVHTARQMYMHSDGLRHQSNISFEINTKTMKYAAADDSYVSHSFNQYVKFKDGNLYQVDHGDGYPRAITLTITNNYQTQKETSVEAEVFKFKGYTGDNFTGAQVGGAEVGYKNVLICGTAQPHGYKVKGVTGSGNGLKENVFVVVADRETGKSQVKWLTTYNPKTSKTTVSEARMVKLSDKRFAILYNTETNGKDKLHYVVVDNNGKKVYSKNYNGMYLYGKSQPILYKGYIQWVATYLKDNRRITKSFRIPAYFK